MAGIFTASTDIGHPRHTSRLIGPLVHWLFPALSDEQVGEVVYGVRKCAHGYEYMVLSWLVWRAFFQLKLNPERPWSSSIAWKAWGIATFYAMTDEWHQTFVPGREGAVRDVVIDSFGAAMGILLLRLFGRWRRWW
jgi:VanZ family protein